MEWIVFKQNPGGSCADYWNEEYVNVEAETNKEACEKTAMDRGEGRYVAFPNTTAEYFDIEVTKIAQVKSSEPYSMV